MCRNGLAGVRREHVLLIPVSGPARGEHSGISQTTSLSHDSAKSERKKIALVIKKAVNLTKKSLQSGKIT